jgi:hypothetical protein
LEGAVDGRLARLEHRGGVGGAEAEHVAEHEYGSLAGRQALERGDEGESDRLAGLIAGLRPGSRVGDALEQRVGVRLEPGLLDAPARRRRPSGRLGRGRELPASSSPKRGQAGVGGYPIQPGTQARAPGEALKPAPRGQERLLDHVLRVLGGAEHPVAVHVELAPVGLDQGPECLLVAASGGVQQAYLCELLTHRSTLSEPPTHRSTANNDASTARN